MLERHEREILNAIMSLQIIQKAPEPGSAALGIRPDFNVFGHAFENWTTKLVLGIYAMQRGGELQIKSGIIFRLHVLAVRLFSHFDL